MRTKTVTGRLVTGAVCALAAVVLTSSPASAALTVERFSGLLYDDDWSHYSNRRCATDPVKFYLDKWPDGDGTRHIASANQGGGGTERGEKYVAGKDSSKKSMGFSSGCFYWNTRQYESTFEVDGEDNFMGQIEY
ncbi:hypothetical protein QQM39_29290 [Streptomyces sp. DT2A-34]|jgi:hypothetical protein|uniref:hypothetical protein n=1 Tax=Streptomyces sp. DT2A-34 TaxID=3051182 RepID=UPI00265C458E|nr:hypothetical protein [Streptomyces sp. DT2A-34]MDO0914777.1 hypothetical protein [Streptomyces sp. DT2A-34]